MNSKHSVKKLVETLKVICKDIKMLLIEWWQGPDKYA